MTNKLAFPRANKIQNLFSNGVLGGTHGEELLTTLLGFIQPIIRAYNTTPISTSSPLSSQEVPKPVEDVSIRDLIIKDEGKKLLVALEQFVTAAVSKMLPQTVETPTLEEDLLNNLGAHTPESVVAPPTQGRTPEKKDANQEAIDEMRKMITNAVRNHVYNKMPIRLLAFSPAGGKAELIDRSEIYRRVAQRVHAAADGLDYGEANPGFNRISLRERRWQIMSDLIAYHARYAILSHTWIRDTPGDVVFQDWASRASNSRGNSKIAKFCEVAAKNHGVELGWMDTVCIDKTSSSELDESIRSMYRWYRNAHICVAYLSETADAQHIPRDSWFTRGWTLQELLAPQDIRLYNKAWEDFLQMEKHNGVLWTMEDIQMLIRTATTITPHEIDFCKHGEINRLPISRRLFLAATREVTRQEDKAYSVMGLLGVDISIAYGEGSERAFSRLIRELLSTRHNILDIFNYGHSASSLNAFEKHPKLVPYGIQQYTFRSDAFDCPSGPDGPSLLDTWTPLEPVVLTHMGVRMTVVLVSAFENARGSLVPHHHFSAHIQATWLTRGPDAQSKLATHHDLILVERQNFRTHGKTVVHLAILNCLVRDDYIVLPDLCLALPLDLHVPPGANAKIIPTQRPVVFRMESLNNKFTVPRAELGKHGLSVETLYL